ncbi:MAG: phenylalanine--tRNA ligase subunit beta [Candidatus Magasanikbacteria bacterium]|nr:phenylalanine--tRNA ligase subunit beta [Candidatus Magasanikbacteria bacterium]
MLISFNWLKQFVDLPDSVTAEEVAEKLKQSTVEVEKVERQGRSLDKIIIGKIIECARHPNADKLKICEVDVGAKLSIVCGGSNVAPGQWVAVAPIGASVVWHGQGEPVVLEKAIIRGVESQGMICAAEEIGLGSMFPKKDDKEILDVGTSVGNAYMRSLQPGTPLSNVLGLNDSILEIDNKSLSNRPDLWGHYGLAREVAALYNRDIKEYKTAVIQEGKDVKIKLNVESEIFCPKIMFVAVSGIKVGPSPEWLQRKLLAVGQKPINNIVDITNLLMFELGKPLHAFDARSLEFLPAGRQGNKNSLEINVRFAKDGEELVLLDGTKIKLSPEYGVIANHDRALSLAGIMGGEGSGINNDTTTIVFETAIFDAASIRKTSTRLGVRSDSSARFEKSLDPNLCEVSLARAVALTLELCPGAKVASKVVSLGKPRLPTGPINIPKNLFIQKLGFDVPLNEAIKILEHLGFTIKAGKKELSVRIPSWRATKDIAIAEDIVEEVVRIFGYDKIPSLLPPRSGALPLPDTLRVLENTVRAVLAGTLGYTETDNYSFVSRAQIEALGDDPNLYLELDNPLSKEKPFLRRHVVLNLLENVVKNIEFAEKLKMFEIGKVYIAEEPGVRAAASGSDLLPRQDVEMTSIFVEKKNEEPFWEAKRAAEAASSVLRLPWRYAPAETKPLHPWMHPTRSSWLTLGTDNTVVGTVFEFHPAVAAALGLESRAAIFALNLSVVDTLILETQKALVYKPLNPFPAVTRDLAFIVKQEITHAQIVSLLKNADPLITAVELFDVYSGSKLNHGYKSLAYHVTLESQAKTLAANEIGGAVKKAEHLLKQKFGAEIR